MWQHPGTLTGQVVRLEPLAPDHLDGLWLASRDPRTWRWLSIVQPQTRAGLEEWLDAALAGPDHPSRRSRGERRGRRQHALPLDPRAPERRDRLDVAGADRVGHRRERRGEAADARARVRAVGCRRVELKTDALNDALARRDGGFRRRLRGRPPPAHARARRREPRLGLVQRARLEWPACGTVYAPARARGLNAAPGQSSRSPTKGGARRARRAARGRRDGGAGVAAEPDEPGGSASAYSRADAIGV